MALLKGKKTYVSAGIAVITAVAAYLTGDISIAEAGQLVLTAVLGVTIRHAVSTETKGN